MSAPPAAVRLSEVAEAAGVSIATASRSLRGLGGVSDTVARALADKLAVQLSTPVVIENKAGASGSLGVDAVAKAAPDGYTLGFAAVSPLALNPHLGKSPFDPQKDIAPVVSVMYSPVLLLGTTASKAADFKDLIATAQAKPGAVRWATSGQASLGHIMLEQIMGKSQVQITHVPYKGGGQQMNDALGGQYEVLSTNAGPAVLQHIKAGKLKPLAVGAPARLDSLPQVPTLAELGQPAANLSSLFGIYAPAQTPVAVLERINARQRVYLTATRLRGRYALRICVLSFRTHRDRMEQALEDIAAARQEALAG